MAKLSEVVLEEGRTFIREKSLDGLVLWAERQIPIVSESTIREYFGKAFALGDPEAAMKLFDKFFPEIDPMKDFAYGCMGLIFTGMIYSLVGLGALGGIVYFVRLVFF